MSEKQFPHAEDCPDARDLRLPGGPLVCSCGSESPFHVKVDKATGVPLNEDGSPDVERWGFRGSLRDGNLPIGLESEGVPQQTQAMKEEGRDIDDEVKAAFIDSIGKLQKIAYANALEKGWDLENLGEQIAMVHSEVAEILDAVRHGNKPDSKVPEFLSSEVEIGDTIIRLLVIAEKRGWRIGAPTISKVLFNMTPEAAADAKGKAF